MRKAWPVFCAIVLGSTMLQAKDASKAANFSGEWVLDFGQTKNPPAGLEAYSMVVNQDQQQLKVETSLKGNLQASQDAVDSGYPGGSRGGRRGGIGGGMGMPGGGMGMPRGGIGMPGSGGGIPNDSGMPGGSSGGGRGGGGGGNGSPRPSSSRGGVAAYKLYPSSAVYKLDGSESTAQLGDSDQTSATTKTEWAKNGEELKLSLAGDENPQGKGGKVQIKEQWKLSADGHSLMLERSVKAPEGSGTVHLVFSKQ